MFIYAGIDEAGYGPMLGPLCVGCSVFSVCGHDPAEGAPNLWRLLSPAVCRSRRDRRRRVAIDDSKLLKGGSTGSAHPLRDLERGVLSMLGARELWPRSDTELFELLEAMLPGAPWYASESALPIAQTADEMRIAAARLRRALNRAEVVCEAARCEIIDVEAFNQQVEQMGNKASVNFCAAMRLLDQVWRRWPKHHPRVVIDRQGGRIRYRETLQLAYPDAYIRILAESEALGRYRLEQDGSWLTVSFVRNAERRHLPVALASMVAKYVRDLSMVRLNRFFTDQSVELKPTAGYVADGRRYLRDIAPLIERLDLPRSCLVRAV